MRLKASASSPCLTALASAISASAVAAAYSCTKQKARSEAVLQMLHYVHKTKGSATASAISASAVAAAHSYINQKARSEAVSRLVYFKVKAVAAAYSYINQKAASEAMSHLVRCLLQTEGFASCTKHRQECGCCLFCQSNTYAQLVAQAQIVQQRHCIELTCNKQTKLGMIDMLYASLQLYTTSHSKYAETLHPKQQSLLLQRL